MAEEKEAFLDRWSRLKQEQPGDKPALPEEKKEDEPLAVLPPLEQLTPESDFTPFMDPRVDGATRRSALKKLFADAHYNVPDPFEAYSEDYTVSEPISMEMLKTLNHAKQLIFDEPAVPAQAAAADPEPPTPDSPPLDPKDVAGKQDA
jgi:Protein of unknown function (DUF3306)